MNPRRLLPLATLLSAGALGALPAHATDKPWT